MDTRGGSAGAHLELVEAELTRIVDFLRRSGAHKIILFGSYARGRRDALVDLDLMVVQKSRLPFVERVARLYRQLAPRVAVDLLVYTPAAWEEMQDRPFIRRALAEGKVLYESIQSPGGLRGSEAGRSLNLLRRFTEIRSMSSRSRMSWRFLFIQVVIWVRKGGKQLRAKNTV